MRSAGRGLLYTAAILFMADQQIAHAQDATLTLNWVDWYRLFGIQWLCTGQSTCSGPGPPHTQQGGSGSLTRSVVQTEFSVVSGPSRKDERALRLENKPAECQTGVVLELSLTPTLVLIAARCALKFP